MTLHCFFRKVTYGANISVGVSSSGLLTVKSLLDTGASLNFINKDFSLQAWKEYFKTTGSPQMFTANCAFEDVEAIVPLFIRTGDFFIQARFGIVENLAVDALLGSSLFGLCIRRIFRTERKVIPWHSRPVAILSTKTVTNSINADNSVLDVNSP